jgi:hypothetical protein
MALGHEDPITSLVAEELARIGNTDAHYAAGFKFVSTLVTLPGMYFFLSSLLYPLKYDYLIGQSITNFQKKPPAPSTPTPEDETSLMERFADTCTRVVCLLHILSLSSLTISLKVPYSSLFNINNGLQDRMCTEHIAMLAHMGLIVKREIKEEKNTSEPTNHTVPTTPSAPPT